ncbi:peptidase domain-containing ABC transporter [Aurantivibrio plasticivorans]
MIRELFGGQYVLPAILQAEQSECGLACVAMVASYYGRKIDLNTLRREYAVSARGANIQEIMGVSQALGLKTRALRLEVADLSKLQLPAVLHWDMKHFVVLKKIGKKNVTIHDPAVGRRDYSISEVGKHFTGIAMEASPGIGFETKKQILRTRLFELFRRYPGFNAAIIQLAVFSLLIQLTGIASAFYMQFVIDEGIAKQDTTFLTSVAIAFGIITLMSVLVSFVRSRIQMYFSNQIGFQMVGNVFDHLMSLPTEYFEKRHVGDLTSRFGSIREIRRIITEDLITVILDGFLALVTLGVMFYFSSTLASIVLLFVVVATTIKISIIPKVRALQEQRLVAEANSNTNLMENMRTIETIKFYCREVPRLLLWRNTYAKQVNANVKLTRFNINVEAAYGIIYGLENVILIYVAATFVISGQITIGFLTAFVALKQNFAASIKSFVDKLVQIRLVKLQLERVSDITCTEPEFKGFYLPKLRPPIEGNLRLENIVFCYSKNEPSILKNINLEIPAGHSIGIVGPSGSGKSTLIKILAGLLQPTKGTVKIDGILINQFGIREYRDVCAGVFQSDQLLSGTILDNITLFSEEIDYEQLNRSVIAAGLDKVIDSLPMKYNSLIGDMGSIMSAGQRQRLLIARAIYKRPKILFLDEATANLDQDSEKIVLQNLASLKITTVIVTHRQSPLSFVHQIYVIKDNGITEVDHEMLMQLT